MAVQGPFAVRFEDVFPHGVGVVGAVVAQVDFDASTKENRVQARDKSTGELVWVVDVMDFDPEARERTFKVKISAPVQPVPPAEVAGLPIRPVRLEGLTVTPYLKESGAGRPRIAYSLRASDSQSSMLRHQPQGIDPTDAARMSHRIPPPHPSKEANRVLRPDQPL